MEINGQTKIIGFLGSTYKTSKMYRVYNAAFHALGLNLVYVPFVIASLKKAIDGIRSLGIWAVGVTMPYKVTILKYLDKLDKDAKRIRAVNFIINKNGKLTGGNTDGEGAVLALKEKTNLEGKNVLLLGAGGAARALAYAISDHKGQVIILNRTVEHAYGLARNVGCQFDSLKNIKKYVKKTDILINATSVGMAPDIDRTLVPSKLLHSKLIVMELVGNPKETRLIKEAKKIGCRVVYADRMLLWQAVLKFKKFTGREAPVEVMEEALKKLNNYGGK